jgi:hypothetical protein
MAIAFVQGNNNTSQSGTSVTLAFLSNNAAGNLLILTVRSANFDVSGVSDTQGNNWTKIDSLANQEFCNCWYAPNSKAGANTVTVTFTGSASFVYLAVGEYSGVKVSSPLDTHNITSGTSSTPAAPSVAATAGDLVLGYVEDGNGETITAGSGYTIRQNNIGAAYEDQLNVAAGNFAPNFTFGASDRWVAGVATFLPAPPVDKAHSADTDIQATVSTSHSADVDIFGTADRVHSADVSIQNDKSQSHSADTYITFQKDSVHHADLLVSPALGSSSHSADAYITVPFSTQSPSHSADVYISPFRAEGFVDLGSNLIVPISDPNAFVKLGSTLLNPALGWVQLAGVLIAQPRSFVKLAPVLAQPALSFVKLGGTLVLGGSPSHFVDVLIAAPARAFVQLGGTLVQPTTPTDCGFFPNVNFVKLGGWLVNNPGVASGLTSVQMPNTAPFALADDWHSDQDAGAAYRPISVFKLAGFPLVVTGFTVGVMSYQTRTKQWLRRVDANAGGVVLSTRTTKAVQANGRIITTTVSTEQIQDTTVVTTTVQDSGVPNRITTTVRETSKSGKVTTREAVTTTFQGIRNTVETKVVSTIPPQTDNIQPIKVTTLDGIQHFQFFDQVNQEWFGGEQEGTTQTTRKESTTPASLAGQTTDKFGNPIVSHVVDELVQSPNGSVVLTHDVTIGIDPNIGTVTTDTQESFNGIQTDTKKFTNYPDGTQQIQETVVNALTGDSLETDTQIQTDEFGQVTTTITQIETKTFADPVSGIVRTQETRTVTVTVGGVTTTSSVTTSDNNFEDDIVNDKIKVFLVQEFTISAIIDDQVLTALSEINIRHQTKYALLELFSQMLGNAQLSWAFRQNLINQYNEAQNCLDPVPFQALGKTYNVVFAPSASAFRDKYITGTEPHAHELQMILQQRSDLITGTRGFL